MRLRLVYRAPGPDAAPATNLQVTADATATAGDLAEALARGPNADATPSSAGPLTLRVLGRGERPAVILPVGQPLVDSGLRSGSTVELVPAVDADRRDRSSDVAAVIRVVGGPDTGIEVPLPVGTSDIGRAADCPVRLTDPMVSKHHARLTVGERVEIVDTNSSNGVLAGGVRVARVPLGVGDVVTLGATRLSLVHLRPLAQLPATSTDIPFVRPSRVLERPEEKKVALPRPPEPQQRARFPWLAMAVPLIMGAVLFFATQQLLGVIFVALSPLLMVGAWLTQRLDNRSRYRDAVANFTESLALAEEQLAAAHETERRQLLALHPSVADTVGGIARLAELLWCRRPEHPEFLQVRLGLGTTRPMVTVEPAPAGNGKRELLRQARDLEKRYELLTGAPIVADLRSAGGLGLCGQREALDGVARAVVTQLVGVHSPAEVVVCCLTSSPGRARWQWLEWLPHTWSPHSPLAVSHLSADPGTGKTLLDALEELVESRLPDRSSGQVRVRGPMEKDEKVEQPVVPAVVVIADQPLVDQARLNRVAERGPDVGVYVIWVAETRLQVPAACRTWLDVQDGTRTAAGMVRAGTTHTPVQCESVSLETADSLARQLAPVVDAGAPLQDESDLPRGVPVVSLLGSEAADDPTLVVTRWRENRSLVERHGSPRPLENPSSLRALVGHSGADPFTLDLRTQGPHALVGGTTGAGKSEFLQAWVLGMAHAYSPDRVTFLFVDYKGGSAFASCVTLPHCVGLVTDLSPHLVRRALRSLRAELRHREQLLNVKGKKDLLELEATGDPECPPSLIIVVDEFAALVGEVPEFVDGVVDVAQRGRSLGLHLVLATQRPAGVIKENLRANTNLRVALRMADEQDSVDVLETPMAAHFDPDTPGRAAAKTGPGRITRFQSAFPGSRTPAQPVAPPIEVMTLSFGAGQQWRLQQRKPLGESVPKDIDRVVSTVVAAAATAAVPPPRRPWVEPLPAVCNLATLSQRRDIELVLGVVDDPDSQSRHTEHFRPDQDGNILVIGASGSGKSTALRTLAVAAAITPGSGPVHVYGLDFAGGALASLETMPNVGSIVPGDDEERVARLIRTLGGLVEERSARFSALRASTITEYREYSGHQDEPRLLLLVDGFGTFKTEWEVAANRAGVYAAFQRLLVDGRSAGVHVALAADRPSAVPASVMAAFTRRIVLRQADDDSYMLLGVPKDVLGPTSPPGRAMQVDNPQELQLAVLGDSVSAAVQARRMEELAAEIGPHHRRRPEPIRALPAEVAAGTVPAQVDGFPVLGVSDVTLAPVGFDPACVMLLAGPAQSGRTSALRWLAHAIRRWGPEVQLIHLAGGRSPLATLDLWSMSETGPDKVGLLADKVLPLVRQSDSGPSMRYAVFIESVPEFTSTPAESALVRLVAACRRAGQLVVGEGETPGWSGGWSLQNEIKNARTGLLLQPDQMDGDTLLRTPLPRVRRADLPPGRGFWIRGGQALKVQLPWVD